MQFTSGYDSGDDKILNALQGNEILDREEISSDEDIAENDLRSRILHLNDFSVPDHANLLSPTRYLEPLNNSMNDPEMSYEQLCRMHFVCCFFSSPQMMI